MKSGVVVNSWNGRLSAAEPLARIAAQPNRTSKHGIRVQLYAALLVLDCACIALGFLLGNLIRFGEVLQPAGINMAVVTIPLFCAFAFNSGAYCIDVLHKPRVGVFRAVASFLVAVTVMLLVAFYLKSSADLSRLVTAIGTTLGVGMIVVTRFGFASVARRRIGVSPISELLIVDGVAYQGRPAMTTIDAQTVGLRPDGFDPLMVDRLGRWLRGVDRVIVACEPERRHRWAMLLKGANIEGEVLAPECDDLDVIGIGSFQGRTTLSVSCGPLDTRSRLMKRALDLAVTLPLVVALAPLMLLTALAIRLDSPGPVFFTQQRMGRGNRLFAMLKFRSMRSDLCDADGNRSTGRDDDRITRVGRFIRSTSIDELPQLLNVLKGDMSLVGPRPHALGSLAGTQLFWEVDPRYWHRHACKPGITGLAQVRGYRGATLESVDLANRLHADLEYLAGWTIWRDVSILFRTFRVLVHKNAF
jgi:exopolysaccharide biosynthesis polyprenyl glycosylphosphotransferase